MNLENWQKTKEIFNEALKLSVAERENYLNRVALENPTLGEQIKLLLESYESGFLEDTAVRHLAQIIENNLKPGQQIGHYEIRELLGTGGMGEVYLAEDTKLKRLVALKVLHPDVTADKNRIQRFIQEARAASALNHPNILTIYEIGTFEQSPFIVSEYVKGKTLRERLREKDLSLGESLEIGSQIAVALEAAHEAGIVHRDIKPENIMLRGDGLVKVLDFGLAKLSIPSASSDGSNIDPEASTMAQVQTNPGMVMGTAAYMSPEQTRGKEVDKRTDIWSLGVVFYEMLSGKPPFPGETTSDIIASILRSEAESLENPDREIPREIEEICFKALEKDPGKRYQTAQHFLQDLKGEKKRMENIIEQAIIKPFEHISEQKTELISPRPTLSAEYIVTSVKRHKSAFLSSLIVLVFLGIGITFYNFNAAPQPGRFNAVSQPLIDPSTTEKDLKFSKLPVSGKISDIAISPDGKYIAYVTGEEKKTSIRLLQTDTSSDVEIVPDRTDGSAGQGNNRFRHLSFAPDGNHLYYVFETSNDKTIYKVPVSGGSPTKIAGDTTSGGSVSPDGETIAFNRWVESEGGGILLILANADGSDQKTLVKSSIDDLIYCGGVPAWSPDGKTIACWVNFTEGKEKYFKLFSINAADGSRQELSDQKWEQISGAVWMPDGKLIVTGKEKSAEYAGPQQIWLIAPNTAPKRITNDLDGFSKISATARGDILVTLQPKLARDLSVLPDNDATRARQVTFSGEIGGGARWTPDGRLVFGSRITNNTQIWTMNPDGTSRKKMTNDPGGNIAPVASPDGRYIFFQSGRTGSLHIFRMDADGGNVKQLTDGDRQRWPQISPDGKWVYYNQIPQNELRKIPSDGGEPVVLATAPQGTVFDYIDVSRVNGLIAYRLIAYEPNSLQLNHRIFIISPDDGALIKTLDLPPTSQQNPPAVSTKFFHWTPDGRSIAFNDSRNNWANIWSIPIDGSEKAKPLTNFTTELTTNFDWSADGKQLVVIRNVETTNGVIISRAE